ncbi:NADP-dependent oxidoreductase [Catenuloplanes atrovinosus]|uniref:NADPH:quinone reductase-like Zn-dependent oxidoreductase n=1 Tax=Catenuloplanes atrovinosus TaxID=137266 RepID=A0AAE3YN88_9ACTN|nr:NADP-dependent oxidoreductase [Catenuloplanes atrovinosus]MDR7275612.1 NADPH:quinone reductase-like Zn-dependent oxidoreductase [Catenuloplanes atrovinosus]
MKAALYRRTGGPEVLEWSDIETPEAGPGEVRVRVRAAGVQPIDCAVRAGFVPGWLKTGLPGIPGNEFAGVVDQSRADGFAAGDEVLGFGFGRSAAEFVVVPAAQVTAKPAAMPWEVAGGFSAAAQTAHIALELLAPKPGETILVHGAAGAVGGVAVQLARRAKARVVGTASAANHDYLRSLGVEPAEYGEGLGDRLRALLPDGADLVLDGAGGEALDLSLELCADRTRILTLVDHGRAAGLGVRTTENLRSAARLAELAALYVAGELRFPIRRSVPMWTAAEAHREVETGHGRGKVVLVA